MADEMRNVEGSRTLLQMGGDVVRLVEDMATRSASLISVIEQEIEPHVSDAFDLARSGAEADGEEWENPDDNPIEGLEHGVLHVTKRVRYLHSAIGELNANMRLLLQEMQEHRILLDDEGDRLKKQDFKKAQRHAEAEARNKKQRRA